MENSKKCLAEGFWAEYYSESLTKDENGKLYVPVKYLEKEKQIWLKQNNIDCAPFAYMKNLEEAVFHDCHLSGISAIAKIPYLKRLTFVNCTFDGEGLPALSKAPVLARLNLDKMSAKGLLELQGLKTLKRLSLGDVTDIKPEDLTVFTNLRTLEINNMDLYDSSFIGNLVELRRLDLNRHTINNLDFLKLLPNLIKFRLVKPAENEDGLLAVNGLKRLKKFIYPVKDMSIYRGCVNLETVGMAPDNRRNFEVFKGSKINAFIVCGSVTNKQMENIATKMKSYCKIYSYGRQC